jgi:hypothetical protein
MPHLAGEGRDMALIRSFTRKYMDRNSLHDEIGADVHDF